MEGFGVCGGFRCAFSEGVLWRVRGLTVLGVVLMVMDVLLHDR